jgi:hypothetical protein
MVQLRKVCDPTSFMDVAHSSIAFCVGTGLWPYTYAACDVGTVPNQTLNGSPSGIAGLSYLPGQRLSACSCSGSDHPGPSVNVGRSAPEIDVLEAQIDVTRFVGQASQSLQVAPFNANYQFNNATSATPLQGSTTEFNSYTGGTFQQAISAVTDLNATNYNGSGYSTYAYEWWSDPNDRSGGYIQWFSGGKQTWKATYSTLAGDTTTGISNRIVPEEPMVRRWYCRGRIITLITVCSTSSSTWGWLVSYAATMSKPSSDNIPYRFLPVARLYALAIPVPHVHRLRPRLSKKRSEKCCQLRPTESSYGNLYQ